MPSTLIRQCVALIAILASATSARAQTSPGVGLAAAPAGQAMRFADDIKAFVAQDKAQPQPAGGILFIGSSIFRQWTTVREQLAPLPILNRAFGGSRTWEVLRYMDEIVLPYRPRVIVYYTGSNDVNAGESAPAITARIKAFVDRVHTALPATRVYFVAINRSPDKRARWDVVDAVNADLRAAGASTPHLRYIDLNPVLFDSTGEPRADLYRPDGLHFHPPAYELFTAIVKPVLVDAWHELGPGATRAAPAALTTEQIMASEALAARYDRSAARETARQQTFRNRPLAAAIQRSFDVNANYLEMAAQMMPESGYGFRPTPDVRTFGEQILHAASSHYSFCNQAGMPPAVSRQTAPSVRGVTQKADVIKVLVESSAYCDRVLAAASEAWLMEVAPNLGGSSSGLVDAIRAHGFMYGNVHDAEDYGTITTYLRMQGVVPPSTARHPSGR